jgi:AGZA family xanthine/uracil permease-like MFS transporter
MPPRHYGAYIIGLFPSIYDWAVNVSFRSPQQALDGFYSSTFPVGSGGFVGVLAWKRGSLLVSMLWVAMIVMVLDRKWVTATIWAFIAALFALFGIIHVPQAGFDEFSTPTYEQCWKGANDAAPTCWDYAEQWMFFVAYLILMAHFAIIEVARRFLKDKSLEDVMDDPSSHAFDDWFAHAATPPEEFAASKHMALSIRNGTALPEEIAMSAKEVDKESSDEVDL